MQPTTELNLVNDKRRLWKYIVFGILTLGIYDIVFMWNMIKDLNKACGHVESGDEDRSPNYIVVVLFSILTFNIYNFVWYYKQGNRVKRAGKAYGLEIDEKGSTYVLWMLVGSLLFGIGPLVAMYLFISNLNKICRLYNYQLENGAQQNGYSNGYDNDNYGGNYGGYIDTPNQRSLPDNRTDVYGDQPYEGGSSFNWIPDDIPTQGTKPTGMIRCIKGAYNGAEIELKPDEEMIIGRSSTYSQLILSDQDISRKHCSVKYSINDGNYYVVDYSTFGVILNDSQKLEKNVSTKCPVGTKLTLGNGNNVFILQ